MNGRFRKNDWTKRENPPGERGKSVKMRRFQLGEIDRQKTVQTATHDESRDRPPRVDVPAEPGLQWTYRSPMGRARCRRNALPIISSSTRRSNGSSAS